VGASHPAAAGTDATPLVIPDPVQLSSAFASIVTRVQPAVVNISTTQVIERRGPGKGRSTRPWEMPQGPQGPGDDRDQQPFQDF
jgi:S1-C subfamily serine protease